MSQNKQRLQRFFEQVVSEGDVDATDELMAAEVVDHDPWPGHPATREGFKSGLREFRTAFPDLAAEVQLMVEEGDKVCIHFKLTGTHLGPFMGAESTGKTISVNAFDVIRMDDGRLAEHWGLIDAHALTEQLGLGA